MKMADQIDKHLRYQDYLIMRLTRLNSIVESLLAEEDTLRHQHTLNHYLKELDRVKREAIEFNDMVQQIIDRAYELKEKTDDETVQN